MGPQVRGDGHRATRGEVDKEQIETDMGDNTGQRALQARGMQEDGDEERISHDRSRALNARGHQRG